MPLEPIKTLALDLLHEFVQKRTYTTERIGQNVECCIGCDRIEGRSGDIDHEQGCIWRRADKLLKRNRRLVRQSRAVQGGKQ